MAARKPQNPIPFINEAKDAALLYLSAKREHFVLSTEMAAKREGVRVAYGAAAALFAQLTLVLALFWFTTQLREAGLPAWTLAVGCLVVLGGVSGTLAALSLKKGSASP